MRYLLDTNILSALLRDPRGPLVVRIAEVGEANVCTSIIVAAELRYGLAKKGSDRLRARLQDVLQAIDILPLEPPADIAYGRIRADLERRGQLIGANDLLIAAQASSLRMTLVTDNLREFSRVDDLLIENWLRA